MSEATGTIEAGKRADLVVFERRSAIRYSVSCGPDVRGGRRRPDVGHGAAPPRRSFRRHTVHRPRRHRFPSQLRMRFRETLGRWERRFRDVKAICLKAWDHAFVSRWCSSPTSALRYFPATSTCLLCVLTAARTSPIGYIAERAVSGDVAVTADIPLAALLVPNSGMSAVTATSPETARSAI